MTGIRDGQLTTEGRANELAAGSYRGFASIPAISTATAQTELLAAVRAVLHEGTAVHAAHAEVGATLHGAHVELRTARLGVRRNGYRYQPTHPETGQAVAADARAAYGDVERACRATRTARKPASSIFMAPNAKMGLHQDRDEQDFDAPVVSISLGDTCLFRVGGLKAQRPHAARFG